MKKMLFPTISLLLAGCGASRQAAKSAETIFRDTATVGTAETASGRTEQKRTTAEQERDEAFVIVTTEYDTSRPVDPTTGTPPVKVRTERLQRTATKTRQKAASESEETETKRSGQETTGHTEQTAVFETTNRRGLNGVQRILCTIGLLAIAGIAGWLLLRRPERQSNGTGTNP